MAEYITKEGMQRLEKRLQELAKEHPIVIKQVSIAREQGDLSENAEYHAAKERQRHIENEINNINKRISKLQVIDTTKIKKDAVRFGAYVTIEEINKNITYKHRLVGIDEVYERNDDLILLSVESPIGKAMIGKKIGEKFTVNAPIGAREFIIKKIS